MEDTVPKESSSKLDEKVTSPRRMGTDNSSKIVQLAIDFAKNGKDLSRTAEDSDKKGNLTKLVKMVKKGFPPPTLTKLMKLNTTDIDRRRQNSLQEFVYIMEKLKQRIVNVKEQDVRMAEDIKQCLQEGHMILAAVILHEMHTIMSMYSEDSLSISRPSLLKLLQDVRVYCESSTP